MKFKTHRDGPIAVGGTSLKGYCPEGTSYGDLVSLFGEPTTGDGYKVDWEWVIRFEDGTVATIYNWKDGPNYTGIPVGPTSVTSWHIGGFDPEAVDRVCDPINLLLKEDS